MTEVQAAQVIIALKAITNSIGFLAVIVAIQSVVIAMKGRD